MSEELEYGVGGGFTLYKVSTLIFGFGKNREDFESIGKKRKVFT